MTADEELVQLRHENAQLRRKLDELHEQHYDECVSLHAEIDLLKQQLRRKEVN